MSTTDISRNTIAELNRRLVNDQLELPVAGPILSQVLKLQSDADSSLRDYVGVINHDPGMAAGLIRMANTAMFAGASKMKTLDEAVVRLGSKNVVNFVVGAAVRESMSTKPSIRDLQTRFWRQGLALAVSGRQTAKYCVPAKKDQVFIAGLLRNLGALAVFNVLPKLEGTDDLSQSDLIDIAAETGPAMTQIILRRWQMADEILEMLNHVEHPADSAPKEAVALALGLILCRHSGLHLSSEDEEPRIAELAQRLGLSDIQIADVEIELEDLVEELEDILG